MKYKVGVGTWNQHHSAWQLAPNVESNPESSAEFLAGMKTATVLPLLDCTSPTARWEFQSSSWGCRCACRSQAKKGAGRSAPKHPHMATLCLSDRERWRCLAALYQSLMSGSLDSMVDLTASIYELYNYILLKFLLKGEILKQSHGSGFNACAVLDDTARADLLSMTSSWTRLSTCSVATNKTWERATWTLISGKVCVT